MQKTSKITIASCGWGDYSPVVWDGDINQPANIIINECMHLLAGATDVDIMPSMAEVAYMVQRAQRLAQLPKPAETKTKTCPRCGGYCMGDCSAN